MRQNIGHSATPEAKLLFEALNQKGLPVIQEYWDQHKHIDLAIPSVHIFIEIDVLYHYVNPKQIEADFNRTRYSNGDNFDTIHIPNHVVKNHLDEVAEAIARVVRDRIKYSIK